MKNFRIAALAAALFLFLPQVLFSQSRSKWDGPGQYFFVRYHEWEDLSRQKDVKPEILQQAREELHTLGLRAVQDKIPIILRYNNPEALKKAEQLGFQPQTRLEGMCTGLFPVQKAAEIEAIEGITSLTLGHRQKTQNDVSRRLTRVSQVQDYYVEHGFDSLYTGKGVVIGIIDLGFDYTHPTFFTDPDDTSTFRIVRVWDQNYGDSSAYHPEGFNYGTELVTTEEILSDQGSCDFFTVFKSEHHGTHVAATAAGSGYGTPYKGMAPGAELVLVSSELMDADIIDGVSYIKKYAEQVGKPCVVNMSFGLNMGPHDGTSVSDSMLNLLSGPGFIMVVSAGNSGAENIHTQGETDGTRPVFIGLDMAGNASLMDVYDYGTGLDVLICVYDTAAGRIYLNDDETQALISFSLATSVGSFVKERTLVCDKNGIRRPVIMARASQQIHAGRLSNLYFVLMGYDRSALPQGCVLAAAVQSMTQGSPTSFHAWCDGMEFNNFGCRKLLSGDNRFSHNASFATADSVISVGAFVSRSRWQVDEDLGHVYYYEGVGEEGDICNFSGRGPRVDGVMKPDITAPGSAVFSAGNSFVRPDRDGRNWSINLGSLITVTEHADIEYPWMEMQGTSMSTPAVAGIVALMLEQDPTLSNRRIKWILNRTAQVDEFVEKGGPNAWGAGKVDALKAMLFMRDSAHIDEPDIEPEPPRDTTRFRVYYSLTDHGRILVLLGDDTIAHGQKVDSGSILRIEAVPDSGYELKMWWDNLERTHTVREYFLNEDLTVWAMFGPETVHTPCRVYIRQTSNGKVEARLEGEELWSGDEVLSGSVLQLKAKPNSGYELERWWNGETRTEFEYTVEADVEIRATFRVEQTPPVDTSHQGEDTTHRPNPVTPSYTVNIAQNTGGTVLVFLENIPVPSGLKIDSGTKLMLVADREPDYELKQWWNGETEEQFEYTVQGPVTISAEFQSKQGPPPPPPTPAYTVNIEQTEGGTVLAFIGTYPIPSGLKVDSGTELMLVADPDPDYELKQWWNGETRTEFEYTVQAPVTVQAVFERIGSGDTAVDTGGVHVRVEPPLPADAGTPIVKAWPNPSRGVFHIQTAEDNLQAVLYSEEGRQTGKFAFGPAGRYTLNLEGRPAGVYLLILNDGKRARGRLRLVLNP